MVSANSRIIHDANSNEGPNHLDDYSSSGNLQMVNYLPSEILHHHPQLKGIKLLEGSYLQPKDQLHVYQGPDGTSTIITSGSLQSQQTSLPLLTPLKYVEFTSQHNIVVSDEQSMIINDDSDKSDCESGEHELHKTPSKLPHKKRIAKKLNSNQPYSQQDQFSVIMPAETNLRNIQTVSRSLKFCHDSLHI